MGNQLREADHQPLSVVHQGVFASRIRNEESVVLERFPKGTMHTEIDGYKGWLYSFVDEFGFKYDMFAYYDGDYYQVYVVNPSIEDELNAHDCHLFDNQRICFGQEYDNGMPTLERAYAKSVLWANGFSVFEQTGTFPFSVNNIN